MTLISANTRRTTREPAPLPAHVLALVDQLPARDADPEYTAATVLDVYGRISRNPETGETEKVDRQLEDCLRDLLPRRARLGKVLRDEGVSARKRTAKRPSWTSWSGGWRRRNRTRGDRRSSPREWCSAVGA